MQKSDLLVKKILTRMEPYRHKRAVPELLRTSRNGQARAVIVMTADIKNQIGGFVKMSRRKTNPFVWGGTPYAPHVYKSFRISIAKDTINAISKGRYFKCLRENRQTELKKCLKHILLNDDTTCFRDAPCSLGKVFLDKRTIPLVIDTCSHCGKKTTDEDIKDKHLYTRFFLCRECFIKYLSNELTFEEDE